VPSAGRPLIRLPCRGLLAATAIAGLSCAAAAGEARAAQAAPDLVRPVLPGRLSDERPLTRWTTALAAVKVRRRPNVKARRIARLRFYTEDRRPEIYLALEQRVGPVYGPIAFGTSAYSRLSEWPGGGVIGIHGTDEPQLIPGRVSHGCVRVRNRAIRRLARRLSIGTPVRIRR
jgi:hypothetical protein